MPDEMLKTLDRLPETGDETKTQELKRNQAKKPTQNEE